MANFPQAQILINSLSKASREVHCWLKIIFVLNCILRNSDLGMHPFMHSDSSKNVASKWANKYVFKFCQYIKQKPNFESL